MKRIVLVTTSYPEQGEGEAAAGVFVRDFALALRAEGIDVHVVAPASTHSRMQETGVGVTRFAAPKLPLSLLNPKRPGDWPAILSTLTAGRDAVMSSCEQHGPDHILALWALPSGAWAKQAGERYGIPYSTWALGSDIWSLGKVPGLRQYLGHVMRHAKHRFADGIQLSKDVADISGQPCAFLPSSRAFGPPTNRPLSSMPPYRLAFLGRWHPNKGVDILLQALVGLSPKDWSHISAIRIHGGGPLEAAVELRCQNLRESGRPVELGGYLDLRGARELFGWADYIVIPSRIESIPVVFSDAMQAGRPIIACPVGDMPLLLQAHDCGLLTESTDATSLITAIRRALNTEPAVFQTGIERAACFFDIQATARRFLHTVSLRQP